MKNLQFQLMICIDNHREITEDNSVIIGVNDLLNYLDPFLPII